MAKKRKKKGKKFREKEKGFERPQVSFKEVKSKRSYKKGILSRLGTYLKEVRAELKKVVWPGRNEVIASVIVVLVMVIIFVLIIAGFDFIFAKLVKWVTLTLK